MFTFKIHSLLIFTSITILLAFEPMSQGATLKWNANSEADLAGYKVSYGTSFGDYETTINVGNITEYKLRFLNEGETYYIAITAYDTSGNESGYSIEIPYTVIDDGIYSGDNCPDIPNGPDLGTCIKTVYSLVLGTGVTCTSDADCDSGETCQMEQGDYNDNSVGDACECYANLDTDQEVGLFDLIITKDEYSRDDCNINPCQADIDGDGEVGLFDITIMKMQYAQKGCPYVIPPCTFP